jgi:hypothetical protein
MVGRGVENHQKLSDVIYGIFHQSKNIESLDESQRNGGCFSKLGSFLAAHIFPFSANEPKNINQDAKIS